MVMEMSRHMAVQGRPYRETNVLVGDEAVCVVKATNVIVEIPSAKETRA
jgi:hypothetical protein